MIPQSTFDQLLLMAYGDLDRNSARSLQEQIKADNNLVNEWHSILRMTGKLDSIVTAPSDTSLKIVLEYSNKTEHLQEI